MLTGEIIHEWEQRILWAMDVAFCVEMGKELEDKRLAHQDEIGKKGKRSK
jgi:hypothetical protein